MPNKRLRWQWANLHTHSCSILCKILWHPWTWYSYQAKPTRRTGPVTVSEGVINTRIQTSAMFTLLEFTFARRRKKPTNTLNSESIINRFLCSDGVTFCSSISTAIILLRIIELNLNLGATLTGRPTIKKSVTTLIIVVRMDLGPCWKRCKTFCWPKKPGHKSFSEFQRIQGTLSTNF